MRAPGGAVTLGRNAGSSGLETSLRPFCRSGPCRYRQRKRLILFIYVMHYNRSFWAYITASFLFPVLGSTTSLSSVSPALLINSDPSAVGSSKKHAIRIFMATTNNSNGSKLLPESPPHSLVETPVKKDILAVVGDHGVTGAGEADIVSDRIASPWDVEQPRQHVTAGLSSHRMSTTLAPALLQKIVFGLGASFGFNALVVANGTLMDYYQETLGLSTSFLSLADFLAGSLTLYAVVGFGYISDITTSSWGRRKPFVVAFTPILALSLVMLFTPGWAPYAGGTGTAAWFGVFYTLSQISMSAMTVVIAAWGTSLTHAVHERASLYTIDALADLLGFLVGVAITAAGTPATTGLALAVIFIFQNLLLVRVLRDDPITPSTGTTATEGSSSTLVQVPFIAGLHMSFDNKQFVALFKAAVFGSIVGTTVNLLPIFFQVVMNVPDSSLKRVYGIYVQAVVASAFVAVLAVGRLNARWGKICVLRFGVACGSLYGLLAFFASYARTVKWFYLTSVPAGFFVGTVTVNGNVLLSNSIDYDQLKTGFRRQSLYQCLMYVPLTFVSVAGSSIPLSIITAFGGLEAGHAPPAAVIQTLRLWISLIVTGCLIVSNNYLSNFKLTEAVQEDISAQLQLREQGNLLPPRDPLQENEPHKNEEVERAGNLPCGTCKGATDVSEKRGVDPGEVCAAVDAELDMSSSMTAAGLWHCTNSFLDLNFSSSELALLATHKGKQWKLWTYLLNIIASAVYAIVLLVETIAAIDQRGDLTGAEVFASFFMLASSMVIYEGGRLHAMKEIYKMGDEQKVARWARRRLSARKSIRHSVLVNPFRLVRREIVAHTMMSITLIFVITSLPSPIRK